MPIEVKNRELHARLLLTTLATQRGFKVLLGQDRVIRRLARFLPKGVIFDKSIGRKGDRKVRLFSKNKFAITVMDEEATGYFNNPEAFTSIRLAEETLDVTERWFCLSDDVRKDISKRYPNHIEKFVTTGLTRTDIWRPEFRGIHEEQTKKLKNRFGKFILFNSNFATIIHAAGEGFTGTQMTRNTKYYKDFTEKMQQHAKQEWANMDGFLKVLPKIANWFPDYKLIVRPHPCDDLDFWNGNLGHHPNIEIVSEGPVAPWLFACECMIHHGCTTGIEAELMSKPHVMYAPARDDMHESKIMKSFATIVRTETELKNTVTKMLSDSTAFGKNKKTLEKYYASLVGKLASEKVVDEFEKIAFPGKELPSYLKYLKYSPRQFIADYWPRTKKALAYSRQKWDGTSVEEITDILADLNGAMGVSTQQSVKQVYPSLFVIEQKT